MGVMTFMTGIETIDIDSERSLLLCKYMPKLGSNDQQCTHTYHTCILNINQFNQSLEGIGSIGSYLLVFSLLGAMVPECT